MTKEQLKLTPDEELLALLLIENHNILSCVKRREEFKNDKGFLELFHMFEETFGEVKLEILRRMAHGNSKK